MKLKRETMLLYAVTDRRWVKEKNLLRQVEEAIKGGVTCVQLREKEMDNLSFLNEAIEMRALCNKYSIPFIVNDSVDVAIKCNADGVHVGQADMAAKMVRAAVGNEMIIGVSASTVQQAIEAQAAGADYLGVGAVFCTATKSDACAVSIDTLNKICNSVDIPVVAIGGINKSNILQLSQSGICGVALISAIFSSDDIENECKILRQLSKKVVGR